MDTSRYLALFLHFFTSQIYTKALNGRKIIRNKRAFDLAQIESNFLEQEEIQQFGIANSEELRDKICRDKCYKNLQLGLDMVKTHSAFGSISVPSLIDENDLKLFCQLDDQHTLCLNSCGFTIHFNMNDFICKHYYTEMAKLLPCYRNATSILREQCGEKKCGPYTDSDKTIIGRARRCRLLICDIKCITDILIQQCTNGQRAAHFLMNYTSQQITFWMNELNVTNGMIKVPYSCSRIFCHKNDLRQCFL